MASTTGNYDIIGDIHGHGDALVRLLEKLGYGKDPMGVYWHPNRKVIFLGDFIDRGEQQARVIDTVMPMVNKAYAMAVMGNHEYNAICYHSTDKKGRYLRSHSQKNWQQHQAFLAEFPLAEQRTVELINWFKALPLFLDLDAIRVIHACWNEPALKSIYSQLSADHQLTEAFLLRSCDPENHEFKAVETLLKGIEIELPAGNHFYDKDKNLRSAIRVKWWAQDARTYQDYALLHKEAIPSISSETLSPDQLIPAYSGDKPVFFGHYWLSGQPEIQSSTAACVDYSVANNEKLVCYRWNAGDSQLFNDRFVVVDA